jgi:transposase
MEGSSQMTQTPTYAGIDVAKDRLDVMLRPSGEYLEATNDERGIRSVVRRLRKEDVALAVLEATGGLEQPAAALALAGVPVAIVNPRQVRDFAKATGKLAKTDRIDAAVLAHFAEAVRPEPRPLADEHARELWTVVLRRRQILAMTTAEANRARTAPKAVRKRIEAHLRWLRKELARVDGELERVVKESLMWKERAALLMSVPGVGPTLSATLLWRSCPSWSTSTAGGSPRWSGWRPSTGTPVPCAGYARCGAAARG